jgi:lysophospholipase L1-like esterase
MKKKQLISKLIILLVLLTLLPINTLAKGPENKVVDYVALGDSLAAGFSPYNVDGIGYPEYIVKRFEQSQYSVEFQNYGVGGFTSEHLKNLILSDQDKQAEIATADLITINIGANDLLSQLESPENIQATLYNIAKNLQIILGTIDKLNPNAEVHIMGYYNPFPYLPLDQQQALLQLLDSLNHIIESSAYNNGDKFVPTAKVIARNYETYLPNPNNIHLSLEGYQVVAKEFWKSISE